MSVVPAALRGLMQVAQLVLPDDPDAEHDRLVVKGQPIDRPSAPDLIVIAYSGDEGSGVTHVETQAGLGSTAQSFDVANMISVLRGDTDIDDTIDRADELVEAYRAELKRDKTLGGVVTRAVLTSFDLIPMQVSAGALTEAPFTVRVDAFRST